MKPPETVDERHAYEQACLEEVKRQIEEDLITKRDRTVVHSSRTEGEYPNTELILDVESQDPHRKRSVTMEFRLWPEGDGDFGSRMPDGSPPPPSSVARDVMIQLYEF